MQPKSTIDCCARTALNIALSGGITKMTRDVQSVELVIRLENTEKPVRGVYIAERSADRKQENVRNKNKKQ